jgi:hypothetical protein
MCFVNTWVSLAYTEAAFNWLISSLNMGAPLFSILILLPHMMITIFTNNKHDKLHAILNNMPEISCYLVNRLC